MKRINPALSLGLSFFRRFTSHAYELSTGSYKSEGTAFLNYITFPENPFIMWYVYILSCSDSDIYTGCTGNIPERLERHEKGHVPATKDRLPVKLIVYTAFENKYKAFEFERYLKTGSGRAFANKHLL